MSTRTRSYPRDAKPLHSHLQTRHLGCKVVVWGAGCGGAVVIDSDLSTAEREAARRWLVRSWASVHPWGSGRVYPNFPDPDLEDWAHAYYGTNYDRLLRVKRRYDPSDFFRFEQSLLGRDPESVAPAT